jgi:two-component system sensor histidine kinase HydH
MVQEVDRLNRVITDLIGFSRPSDLKRVSTDVAELAGHCLRLLGADAAAQHVVLSLEKADDLPPLDLDPDRFSQALLNICLNGMEAMPAGGTLRVHVDREDAEFVRVRISDTGLGIAAESLGRIFDPYYTTKSQGTGLGLAIVHKIVEAHGGAVRVTSRAAGEAGNVPQESSGTTFTILLPISTAS